METYKDKLAAAKAMEPARSNVQLCDHDTPPPSRALSVRARILAAGGTEAAASRHPYPWGVPGDAEAVAVERLLALFALEALMNERVGRLGDEVAEQDGTAEIEEEAAHLQSPPQHGCAEDDAVPAEEAE